MMDNLEITISEVLRRLNHPIGRAGRTKCPIHGGDNWTAFSYDDKKGSWYCFRCGEGGDPVRLVMRVLSLEFKAALSWLGVQPRKFSESKVAALSSQESKVAPELQEFQRLMLNEEYESLYLEFLAREKVITRARARLELDPDDEMAWNWLGWAFKNHAAIEYELDLMSEKRLGKKREF